MDYTVNIKDFVIVEDNQDKIPKDFSSCCVIDKRENVMFMVWDESLSGKALDKRGSFFDGIGGHLALEDVIAWKAVDNLKAVKI